MIKNSKLIIVGNVNSELHPSGPANVILNLLKNNKSEIQFINTYCTNKFEKIKLIIKVISLVLKKNRIINVHSFGYKIPNLVLKISKINPYNKYILTLHGLMSIEADFIEEGSYKEYRAKKEYYNKIEERLIKEFPNIVCVSKAHKDLLRKLYGREKRVSVIYNGVNTQPYCEHKINKSLNLVMAGGIFNRKGIFEMINFVEYYNSKYNFKINLDIYGGTESDSALEKFKKEIKDNKLEEYVRYKGTINNTTLLEKFRNADLCVSFSKFDTFNLTILESMSVGTPCIVSKQCGVSELICDRQNGFIIDMDENYISQAENIIESIKCKSINLENISKNAYDTSRNYDWKNISNRYNEVFEEINRESI